MKTLMLMLFFAVAGLSRPAQAADPIQGDWPPIPGNRGMAWFHDTWYPHFSHNWHAVGSYTYLPSGVIAYEKGSPDDRYRVVEEREGYVILLVRPHDADGHTHYRFEYLHLDPLTPEQRAADVAQKVVLGRCSGDSKLKTERDLLVLPQARLQTLWAESYCNPLAGKNRATAKYPWGDLGWSTERIERLGDYGRVEAAKQWARKQGVSPEEVDWPHLPKQ